MSELVTRRLPRRRVDGIVVQEISDEVLVYDLERHKAHCLNRTSALVWNRCDGQTSVSELKRLLEQELGAMPDDDLILLAIEQLSKRHLLEQGFARLESNSISRRALVRKLGLATAVALPLITSLVAPTPAQAATCVPNGGACSTGAQCCSGICSGSTCVATLF